MDARDVVEHCGGEDERADDGDHLASLGARAVGGELLRGRWGTERGRRGRRRRRGGERGKEELRGGVECGRGRRRRGRRGERRRRERERSGRGRAGHRRDEVGGNGRSGRSGKSGRNKVRVGLCAAGRLLRWWRVGSAVGPHVLEQRHLRRERDNYCGMNDMI